MTETVNNRGRQQELVFGQLDGLTSVIRGHSLNEV